MVSSSTNKNNAAPAASSAKKPKTANESWSYKDYFTVRILVDEIIDKPGDIKKEHLSDIFAEVCPHKKRYTSEALHSHKTMSTNPSVAKDKQRAWRKNDYSNIPYPSPDRDLWVEIKQAIADSPTFREIQDEAGSDTEDCGRLELEDARRAEEAEADNEQ
ncbi:hypothetical protein CLAFUW4_10728 [Fulvia fulva]|nr:hypothetical protein CLAFUR4_10733 [Fulvia fulva]WPV19516.1 hypothetical protein CLAFUW4_10728 [Fulvia fulva]WPV34361.1 hypothetical protein CLAFUW7_10730 [Fulvia fulva]